MEKLEKLNITSVIGMNGKVENGLQVHPNATHLVHPLGDKIIVRNMAKKTLAFLDGHTNCITCLTISKTGQLIASGQVTHMGFKTSVIVWDFDMQKKIGEHTVHKVNVQDVAVSPNDKFVVSIGGMDDENVVVYCLTKKEPIIAVLAASGMAGLPNRILCANLTDLMFVTGGKNTFRVWHLEPELRLVTPFNTVLGFLKREVISLMIDQTDEHVYAGTRTGDILKVRLNVVPSVGFPGKMEYQPILVSAITKHIAPKASIAPDCVVENGCFSQGVTSVQLLKNKDLLVSGGDGTVCQGREEMVICTASTITKMIGGKKTKDIKLQEIKSLNVNEGISSLTIRGEGHQFYVGTFTSEIFVVNTLDFTSELLYTCHSSAIKDIVFPPKTCELFASCGDTIRIWNTSTTTELLRISIPNMSCLGIQFAPDGKSIVSGWNDGTVRSFTPETGKYIFVIEDAHSRGVTAIKITFDGKQIITGGEEGMVKIWDLYTDNQKLKVNLVEHRGPITALAVRKDATECVSSSLDGTCIIWDLITLKRKQMIHGTAMFVEAVYHPEECQLLTGSTDHKIYFWEVFDGQMVRELEGSGTGGVNSMDISKDGSVFISGGNDKIVKVWKYRDGEQTHFGGPLGADINIVRLSHDLKYIIAGCEDGSIYIWRCPNLDIIPC